MTLTPLEARLINTMRDRGIDAGDVRDLLIRARKEPRLAWDYWLRWRDSKIHPTALHRWRSAAWRIAADLMAVACPPWLADEPPEDTPIAWTPEVER